MVDWGRTRRGCPIPRLRGVTFWSSLPKSGRLRRITSSRPRRRAVLVGMETNVAYDKRDQLEKVQASLLEGEQLLAVYDCTGAGTGFVGVTDRRVVLQDNSFVGKQQAVTSIPYRQVQAVSFVSDKSMFGKFASSSTIAITSGGVVREATFRGDEKARYVHDTVLRFSMV